MKNRKLRKALMLVFSAMLLVAISVGATVAYLTSTGEVTNTFTVGNVQIILDEAPVDENGKKTDGERVIENNYKVYPNGTYDKDPTVTVKAGSEESYIFMAVKPETLAALKTAFPVGKYPDFYAGELFLLEKLVDWQKDAWQSIAFEENGTYIFQYKEAVSTVGAAGDKKLEPLFTKITMPEEMTNDELAALQNLKINIGAFAIQTDSIDEVTVLKEAKAAFAEMFKAEDASEGGEENA